jgi:xanthine dehydrogenase accessory factor
MNDNKYLSNVISNQLKAGLPVVLTTIVSMEGSTPRESGTKMVVDADGTIYGTIGGSLLEATVITESGRVLAERRSKFIEFDLTGSDTASEDMICGGKAVVLLDYIPPTEENWEIFNQMNEFISKGNNFYFLTGFTEFDNAVGIAGHCLLFSNGRQFGDNILLETDLPGLREELHNFSSTTVFPVSDKKIIIDPIRKIKSLFCFGAGHVALPTAHIAAMVGFRVIVIDDREEFANKERFPEASNIYVIEDFGHALESLDIDTDSFIIILTRGHKYDRVVLEQALNTTASYIGMISSRTKRDAIYKTLIDKGVATAEDLKRVHSPIGLAIGGDTPEEIAVSIVAELIFEREKQT